MQEFPSPLAISSWIRPNYFVNDEFNQVEHVDFVHNNRLHLRLGNAIPDRFANPGISGLSLLNPGIPGLIPGLNRARLWLAIAGLVIGKIATTRTTRYRLNCAMHIVIGRLSCAFLHWHFFIWFFLVFIVKVLCCFMRK